MQIMRHIFQSIVNNASAKYCLFVGLKHILFNVVNIVLGVPYLCDILTLLYVCYILICK